MILSKPGWASTDYYVTYGFLEWERKKNGLGIPQASGGLEPVTGERRARKLAGIDFGGHSYPETYDI